MSQGILRFAIALALLFFIKLKFAPGEKLRVRDIPLLFGAGLTGVTFYFYCENNGVNLVSPSEASIAIGAIPVFIMIADWLSAKFSDPVFLRTATITRVLGATFIGRTLLRSALFERTKNNSHPKPGIFQWIGAFTSIAGVWLVAGVSFALSGSIRGYVFMAGAALCWTAYSLLTRPLFKRCSRIYIVFWQSVAGFLGFLPFSIMEFPKWGNPAMPVILHLLFLGICCSALGYWLYAHSLEVLGMTVSAIFINMIPLVTVIFGFIINGDRLTFLQWIGAALVIGGVYLSMLKR